MESSRGSSAAIAKTRRSSWPNGTATDSLGIDNSDQSSGHPTLDDAIAAISSDVAGTAMVPGSEPRSMD